MNALTKSAAALAAVALFAAAAPAQACMPMMMMSGAGAPSCNSQPAPQVQACPVPEERAAQASDCAGNAQMAGMMGEMAAGGMGIAMAVIGALFGPPAP